MKVPRLTSLRLEDFPADQRSWLGRLFLPLNSFLLASSNAFNGQITFGDNIPAQDQILNFVYDGTTQKFAWSLAVQPNFYMVGRATEDGVPIAVQVVWFYASDTNTIQISQILKLTSTGSVGLSVGKRYHIPLRFMP